jgi:hypothetical protein
MWTLAGRLQLALDLLDAFGSKEKTPHANMAGTPASRSSKGSTGTGTTPGT